MNHKHLALIGFLTLAASTRAATPVIMTFDLLAADNADYSSYTENGLTLASTGGSSQRFFATGFIGNTTANIYQWDGDPQRLTYSGGQFDLNSVDFTDFATGSTALVTASTGATQTVSTMGTVTFGAGFSHASWVSFSFGTSTGIDPNYTIDNITVTPVPEPATWGMLAALALGAWSIGRRNSR